MNARGYESDVRPAVVEGQVVWLPTLSGLLGGVVATEPVANRQELWAALAAAVMSDAAFDALDTQLANGKELATVIELDSYRPRPHELD